MSKSKEKISENPPGQIEEKFSTRREAIRATRVGGEIPDPTPVEIPVGHSRPLTLREEMMRFIRQEMSQQAKADGHETFEEFDDLDVPDDEEPDMSTPYTVEYITLKDEEGALLLDPTEEDEKGAERPTDAPLSPPENTPLEGAEGPESPKDETPAPSRG